MNDKDKRVLVFTKYYIPAYKAGGPIRSIEGIVHHLNDNFTFYIITSDRDANGKTSFDHVNINKWNNIDGAEVFYCSPDNRSYADLVQICDDIEYNLIYANNFFGYNFGIKPVTLWELGLLGDVPMIFAPRGVFSPDVLKINEIKKRAYIYLFKSLGVHNDLVFHASTDKEKKHIQSVMGSEASISVAENLPCKTKSNDIQTTSTGGPLKVIFLSRISIKKNLDFAISVLRDVDIDVVFNVYGPVKDENYWKKCKTLMDSPGRNVDIAYKGSLSHEYVGRVLSNHDLFFLPTKGENYGHVIFEALSNGCPVLISDKTPWDKVREHKAGWVIPLTEKYEYAETIRKYSELTEEEQKQWRKRAVGLANKIIDNSDNVQNHRRMFDRLITE